MAQTRMNHLPRIAITMGDPAGVGPEVLLKALSDPAVEALARWIVVGDRRVLEMAEQQTGRTIQDVEILDVPALGDMSDFEFGRLNASCGRAAVEYVREATELCLKGEAGAMVTAPLNKEAVTLSGRKFSGHTEYIAELCGATESRMLLASEKLCTIHVTTHTALRNACNLDTRRIERTIELGNEAMKLLGFVKPRIAVCGLNPHAGGAWFVRTGGRAVHPTGNSDGEAKRHQSAPVHMPAIQYSCRHCAALTTWWLPCITTRDTFR